MYGDTVQVRAQGTHLHGDQRRARSSRADVRRRHEHPRGPRGHGLLCLAHPSSLLLAAKLVAVENPSVDPMVVLGETARIRWGFEAWQPDGLSIQGSQGSERLTAARLVDSANGTLDHYDLTEMFGPWTGELSTTAPTAEP